MREDLYRSITDQIVAAVKDRAGVVRLPWHAGALGSPVNAVSGRAYRGINTLILWASASSSEYSSSSWATYRQWAASGAQVRKNERSTVVRLWKAEGASRDQSDDAKPTRQRLLARAFHVFNADQVDGYAGAPPSLPEDARIVAAERFFGRMPATVDQGGAQAFYDPASDSITMPPFGAFVSAEAYYGVLAHELTHWTGAPVRLGRDLSGRFGTAAYAMEELIAELGAAFVAGHLGIAAEPRDDHAAYIRIWLQVLKDDPRAIVTAASQAQAAADFLIAAAEPAESPDVPTAEIGG